MRGGGGIHLGTFDAERSWRPSDLAELPGAALRDPHAERAVETMNELLAAFCGPDDLLVTRHPMATGVRDGYSALGVGFAHHRVEAAVDRPVEQVLAEAPDVSELLGGYVALEPWAVREETRFLADRLGLGGGMPATDVVARVNSKSWSNALVQELGLPGAGRVVRSTDELDEAVAGLGHDAVVKDPYGVSGKGALEVSSPRVLKAVRRTLDRQTARGRRVELVVQERYDRYRDFSAHLRVARDGTWELLGVRTSVNRGFRHIGSGPPSDGLGARLEEEGYPEVLEAVAGALARAGYWGPVGVDSMLLADGTLIPLLEINARRSLGLVALALDSRAAERGLRCWLWQLDLGVPPNRGVRDLVEGLHRTGVLYGGGARPGVLVLGGSVLAPPRGRVYCALLCPPDEVEPMRARTVEAAEAAGMTPWGGVTGAA
ncbi:hypothetical protein [Nocardiopsis sp. CA-288880]|uniref:hypothetical protein n=1 Tax=Nocardiopsis sp. CA-288880 TaxID=3239995 RepID=UPI003D97B8E1